MPVPISRTGEQSTNRLNGLPIAADDAADIRLAHGEAEDGSVAVRNFGDQDFVGKFNQIADHEFEKRFHACSLNVLYAFVQFFEQTSA